MKKAFTLIELLIVVAIIAILAAIAVPNFLEAQVRAKVSRVKSDQRTYSTALETFYIDNNTYPEYWATGRQALTGYTPAPTAGNVNNTLPGVQGAEQTALAHIPSFHVRGNSQLQTLTTPVSYLSAYVSDTFMNTKAATFGYMAVGPQYLVFSPGPDADQDSFTDIGHTPATFLLTLLTSGASLPSPSLLSRFGGNTDTGGNAYTYDPTNGTSSGGDVWRVKG